jgi:hypothetical protein
LQRFLNEFERFIILRARHKPFRQDKSPLKLKESVNTFFGEWKDIVEGHTKRFLGRDLDAV